MIKYLWFLAMIAGCSSRLDPVRTDVIHFCTDADTDDTDTDTDTDTEG